MAQERKGHVGGWERAARVALGIVLLGFAIICPFAQSLGPAVVWVSGVLGALFLGTGVLGWCPLYRVLGLPR